MKYEEFVEAMKELIAPEGMLRVVGIDHSAPPFEGHTVIDDVKDIVAAKELAAESAEEYDAIVAYDEKGACAELTLKKNDNLTKERIYLKPDEKAPEGYAEQQGTAGGRFYESEGKKPAEEKPEGKKPQAGQEQKPQEGGVQTKMPDKLPDDPKEYKRLYPPIMYKVDEKTQAEVGGMLAKFGFQPTDKGVFKNENDTVLFIPTGELPSMRMGYSPERVAEVVKQIPAPLVKGLAITFQTQPKWMPNSLADFNPNFKEINLYPVDVNHFNEMWKGIRAKDTDFVKEVILHEVGHNTMRELPTKKSLDEWLEISKKGKYPTKYASMDAGEDFAETFMLYVCSEENRKRLDKDRVAFFGKYLPMIKDTVIKDDGQERSLGTLFSDPFYFDSEGNKTEADGAVLGVVWRNGRETWFVPNRETTKDAVTSGTAGAYNALYSRRKKEMVKLVEKTLGEVIGETQTIAKATNGKDTLVEFLMNSLYKDSFEGMTQRMSDMLKEYLVRSMLKTRPMPKMAAYIYQHGGNNITQERAEMIARTETQALRNKMREWAYNKVDPEGDFKYKWINPLDNRTTEICRHLVSSTKKGVSLAELKAMVERESKAAGFEPREFTPHINCRSTYVRVM